MKAILLRLSETDFIRLKNDKLLKCLEQKKFMNWEEYIITLVKGGKNGNKTRNNYFSVQVST
jgi:hypothetical protein